MLKRWKKLTTTRVCQNPWWSYWIDEFEIPGGVRGEYHYVRTNGSSMVIPLTAEGQIILVNQYRYLGGQDSLEFPCGSVKPEHDYRQTARCELQEETGFRAGRIQEIGHFNPYNGVTDEICKVFLADQLEPSPADPDATEEFELILRHPVEIDDMIRKGIIWDGMSLAAWTLARRRVAEHLAD